MKLNTDHFLRCIETLESSLIHLQASDPKTIEYEVFRNAVIKGFELTLETAGKLLRKTLKSYTAIPKSIDELNYKDVLREAAKHHLLSTDAVERWFKYRDNRNDTAHDYGLEFAEETLSLLPDFLVDAKSLQQFFQANLGKKNA